MLNIDNTHLVWFSFLTENQRDEISDNITNNFKHYKILNESHELFLFDSYSDFYKTVLSGGFNQYTKCKKTVVVFDIYYWALSISDNKNIAFIDLDKSDKFYLQPKAYNSSFNASSNIFNTDSYNLFSFLNSADVEHLDLHKKILSTYDTTIFFEHFNTFKYKLSKDLRKDYELLIYNFFIGNLNKEGFIMSLNKLEHRLKAGQYLKYEPVKIYLNSNNSDILLNLVRETDDAIVKQTLEKHKLDYFDLNYLKAFLRDYGKPKSKTRRKHNMKLENEGENIVNITEDEQ